MEYLDPDSYYLETHSLVLLFEVSMLHFLSIWQLNRRFRLWIKLLGFQSILNKIYWSCISRVLIVLLKGIKLECYVKKLIFALSFGWIETNFNFLETSRSFKIFKTNTSSIKVITEVKNPWEIALLGHGKTILGILAFLLFFGLFLTP